MKNSEFVSFALNEYTWHLWLLHLRSADGVESGICEFSSLRKHLGFICFVGLLGGDY